MRPNPIPRGLFAGIALVLALICSVETATGQIFGGRRQPPPTAIRLGVLHPVDGPAIKDAVVIITGGRITAVGPASEIEIPKKAKVIDHSTMHGYPGLIDAMSTAYCTGGVARETGTDASTEIAESLDRYDETSAGLIEHGVTTAYVSNRGGTTWRGIGAIVRPSTRGFSSFRSAPKAPVHLRMTAGPGPSHALSRTEQLASVSKIFDRLEGYEKKRTKFDEDVAKFEDEWKEYIAYHEKKNGIEPSAKKKDEKGKKDDKKGEDGKKAKPGDKAKPDAKKDGGDNKGDADKKEGETPSKDKPSPEKTPGDGDKPRRRGRRGRRPAGSKAAASKKPATDGKKGADGKDKKSAGKDGKDDKAPKRPKYPREPKVEPVNETLIEVRDGERFLRIEAQRPDEVRAALEFERDVSVDGVVLEGAVGAGDMAEELAKAGVSVVVGGVSFDDPKGAGYLDENDPDLLKKLEAAGVPVAIGSGGSVRRARHLPLIAAQAAARGLSEEAAVQALTLAPARILGIDDRVGSITAGKVADMIVTSAPLLSSDARIVQVFSAGTPVIATK